jgi:hypothetical protein
MITNRPRSVSAVKDIDLQLGNLNVLMTQSINQPVFLNQVNVVKGLIGAKLVEFNQTIKFRQSHGINAA